MKWPIVAIVTLSSFSVAVLKPEWLAKNTFLASLVSYELVSILIVILTVTMASVANIHLALGRLKKSLADKGVDIGEQISGARRELSENAWYLFGSFCILLVDLLFKGSLEPESIFWIAMTHAIAIVILTVNLAILYDIYISVYMLTSLDEPPHPGQSGDGSEIGDGHG
ncbi:conserved membrane hypothetical protein [Mesorhizobium plurifarium]|uniref:DUF2721 domain-containing protein n=1 Tax=Mesorhizobium plurifarium TaxID=69974 RepID=A0A090FF43_MESPL|nr:conserved membrane hypothetical protein [Mesorhizobium plurifarium]